ncbi:CheR family methyltransferase [Sessilibacter corallicola]|uniref:protein-glutamate O-methyltransferase n=1 Tax=Sessilibacter corallicola TaxID=2904075 RepID=A0ABQ0A5K5_9GAMM|nr:protein-glutamate O-methyltransferase CheR [Sessilibacter corallicola]
MWSVEALSSLTEEQIQLWAELLERKTGIQLGEIRLSHLQTQVALRMKELELKDPDEYFHKVSQDYREWLIVMDRLLVKETQFFRHRESIDFVKREIFNRINADELNDSFDAWSLGCSTGEEAYSIAAAIHDGFTLAKGNTYFSVTGTDISQSALNHARKAVYSEARLVQLTDQEKSRYFNRGADSSQFVVKPEIAQRVNFIRGNICELDAMPKLPMDVIFCQNLLVYFRRWRRRDILKQLIDWLKPNGILIIGVGEIVGWEHNKIKAIPANGVQAYQRR